MQKNVTLPTELDAKHKATHDRLAKLSGDAFDKAYMQATWLPTTRRRRGVQQGVEDGKDADLKAWAGKTLPTLEDHLKLAQDTAAKVGATTAPKTPKKK